MSANIHAPLHGEGTLTASGRALFFVLNEDGTPHYFTEQGVQAVTRLFEETLQKEL